MKKILLVEDDKKIRRLLQLELEHEGYSVDFAEDGEKALEKFQNNFYNIILLDLMIPILSGEEVCKKIRETSEVPIIVITAKGHTLSKIQLLDMGADDYLTKPFEMGELFARIRVLFRNKSDFINKDFLSYENLKLDKKRKILYRENEEITLTKTEYNLMEYFIINKEIVSSREKILNEIWGYDYDGEDKIVDVYINTLRKKIDNSDSKYIHTLRGFGYVLKYETKEVKK